MDPAAVALVLAAAVLHALWNVRLHGADDRVAAMAMSGLISGLVLLPFFVLDPPSGVWGLLLISGVAEAVYGLALAGAYRRGELSVTYPVGRGSAPLMATLAATVVVGQPASARTVVAASLVAVGLGLLAFRSHRSGTLAATGLALIVGATIATYSVVDARAVGLGAAPLAYLAGALAHRGRAHGLDHGVRPCAPARLAPAGRRDRARQRRRVRARAVRLPAWLPSGRWRPCARCRSCWRC